MIRRCQRDDERMGHVRKVEMKRERGGVREGGVMRE